MTHQVESPQFGEPDEPPAGPAATSPEPGPDAATGSRSGGVWSLVREVGLVLVSALLLSLLIKTFLLQAFFIPSGSMEDTLVEDDRVVVSKLTPGPIDLKRGDIVVFEDAGHWLIPALKPHHGAVQSAAIRALTFIGVLPSDSGEHLIKRVIGLPGDTVECCDAQGRLTVNGKPIDEAAYLKPGAQPSGTPFKIVVPPGRLWVMGDNRGGSADSRAHPEDGHHGTVAIDSVVGRAFVLVWPGDRFRWLSNPGEVFKDVPQPR